MKHLSIKPSILPVICRFIPALFAISLAHAVPEKVTFNEDIRPILSDKCFACHGFDKNAREAELRLDTAEGAASVIKPGDPDKSELFQHITAHDPDEIMPPPETIKKLTDADRNLIRKWIEQGAEYESHWAYLKPVRHSPIRMPLIISSRRNSRSKILGPRHLQRSGAWCVVSIRISSVFLRRLRRWKRD